MKTPAQLQAEERELLDGLERAICGTMTDEQRGELARRFPGAISEIVRLENAEKSGHHTASRVSVGRDAAGNWHVNEVHTR